MGDEADNLCRVSMDVFPTNLIFSEAKPSLVKLLHALCSVQNNKSDILSIIILFISSGIFLSKLLHPDSI